MSYGCLDTVRPRLGLGCPIQGGGYQDLEAGLCRQEEGEGGEGREGKELQERVVEVGQDSLDNKSLSLCVVLSFT